MADRNTKLGDVKVGDRVWSEDLGWLRWDGRRWEMLGDGSALETRAPEALHRVASQ